MVAVTKAKTRMVWQPTQRKQIESQPMCREPLSEQCSFGAVADSDEDPNPKTASLKAEVFKHACRVLPRSTAGSDSTVDSTDSGTSSLCGSLDSSSEDCCDLAPETAPIYTADSLLQLRGVMLRSHLLPEAASGAWILRTAERPAEELEKAEKPPTRKPRALDSPKASDGARKEQAGKETSKLLPASPNSWAEQQRLRRQKEEAQQPVGELHEQAAVSDAEMTRRIKSILNKLTPEKFATLYEKLAQVGMTELSHLEIMARLVFEEAAMQHSFSGMYAELCMYMINDLGEYAAGAVLQEHLFVQCMQLLECSLDQALACTSPRQAEDEEEAKAMQKKRLIGSTRFTGELIIRCVFPGEVLFTHTEWLSQRPIDALNLERLVALLTVVGPVLDNAMWPLHENLVPIFWSVHGLTFDAEVPKRVRCLLRDFVELREAGWVVAGGKARERPMTLDEVRCAAGHGGQSGQGHSKGKKSKTKKGRAAKPPLTLDLAGMTAGDFCTFGSCVTWDYCDPSEMYQGFDMEGMQYQYIDMGFVFDQQQTPYGDEAGYEQKQPDFERPGCDEQTQLGLEEEEEQQQQPGSDMQEQGADSDLLCGQSFAEQGEAA